MNKRALTTIETETFVPPTLTARDQPPQPVSEDSGAYASNSETRGRAALRWLVETLALAGCGMAGVWLDRLNVSDDQTSRKDGPDGIG